MSQRVIQSLFRNSFLNLLGQGLPLLVGLLTIPRIIAGLGIEQFGLLSLVWVFLGYFSLFDFGLSRSITLFTSKALSDGKRDQIGPLFWSSCLFILVISILGAFLVLIGTQDSVLHLFQVSEALKHELKIALLLIAISLPVVTLTTALKGLLEAAHKFSILNFLQILLGVYTFVTPLIVFHWTMQLSHIVLVLVIGRFLFFLIHIPICLKEFPEVKNVYLASREEFKKTLHFGGWLTVSNIVGPVMFYFDRFFLSAMVPVSQIAFYTAPYEMMSRLLIIPASLTRALFPSLSADKQNSLYKPSLISMALVMGSLCFSFFMGAEWGLNIWLGPQFAQFSTPVIKLLSIGIFLNSLAWIPFTLIQSQGRSDLTAKAHLVELPIYLGLLVVLILKFGILGAALAWTLRASADCLIMFAIARTKGIKADEFYQK